MPIVLNLHSLPFLGVVDGGVGGGEASMAFDDAGVQSLGRAVISGRKQRDRAACVH